MQTDSSPFFTIAKCERFREYASVAISSAGVAGISWKHWNADWTMDALLGVIKEIAESKSVYIGVTESPIWRWELCRDHTDTDMKAHRGHYEKKPVLCVDCRDCIQVFEEHILGQLRTAPRVPKGIPNDPVYRPGPWNRSGVLYLYDCSI